MKRSSEMKRKELSLLLSKAPGNGAALSEDQLAKIRKYTLEELSAESLYARKMLLAHNAIDRDNERFSEKLLEDFARTLPGKGLLMGHEHGYPGVGTFFDAAVEEMDIKTAREMTGEDLKLPEGVGQFKALMAWFYTARTPGKESLLADIDAGIARHVSIGFKAANLVKVSNEQSGEVLYWEYKAPGEAREGSLVWLGAQNGATITKSVEDDGVDIDKDGKNGKKEKKAMKTLLKKLGLGEDATEDQALSILNEKLVRLKSLEEVVAPLGENASKAVVEELIRNSEDGKTYRKNLVSRQVKCERLLGRVGDKDDDAKAREGELMKRSVSEVKGDVSYLEKLVAEKFPDKAALDGGDPNAQRGGGQSEQTKKKYALVGR